MRFFLDTQKVISEKKRIFTHSYVLGTIMFFTHYFWVLFFWVCTRYKTLAKFQSSLTLVRLKVVQHECRIKITICKFRYDKSYFKIDTNIYGAYFVFSYFVIYLGQSYQRKNLPKSQKFRKCTIQKLEFLEKQIVKFLVIMGPFCSH